MSDEFDKDIDVSIARAQDTISRTKALIDQADRDSREFADWKEANGIRTELHEKVYAGLSDADRAKINEERERFERELRQDMDDAMARAFPTRSKPGGIRRGQIRI
ncbi:MAG: hypothetical protein LBV80_02785 [Deltaproteobacteria bacterium]|jgi:hypothetical protein|nr:hypothetical protein [Deltaproteobacteria bacterium]